MLTLVSLMTQNYSPRQHFFDIIVLFFWEPRCYFLQVHNKSVCSLYRYSEFAGEDSADSDSEIEATEDLDEKVAVQIFLLL
jgi:hypothetical protein